MILSSFFAPFRIYKIIQSIIFHTIVHMCQRTITGRLAAMILHRIYFTFLAFGTETCCGYACRRLSRLKGNASAREIERLCEYRDTIIWLEYKKVSVKL